MAERMSMTVFFELYGAVVHGYVLHPGQKQPETYEELVAFMGDRLGLDERDISVSGLS